MAFTHVRTVTTTWFLNGTSPSITVPATGAHNLLVMLVSQPNADATVCTFPAGWATPITAKNGNAGFAASYYINNPGGITSITVNGVINATDTHVTFLEFSSTGNDAAFDSSNTGFGHGGISAVTTTLSQASGLVIGLTAVSFYQETGTPSYDSGYTGNSFHNVGVGTTYAEYNVAATSASIQVTPGGSVADDWQTLALAFNEPGPSGIVHSTLTPSTTMSAVPHIHSGSMLTSPVPSTQTVSSNRVTRGLSTSLSPFARMAAGGYSPRTIPLSAVIGSRVRIIVMGATLGFVTPTRTIPLSAALQSSSESNQRQIPISVCFVFHTIPISVNFRQTNTRTVQTSAVFGVFGRIIPAHAVFTVPLLAQRRIPAFGNLAKVIVVKRTIPVGGLFAVTHRVIPAHARMGTLSLVVRTIRAEAIFVPIQTNVKRTIPTRGVFFLQFGDVKRTIPVQSTFVAGFTRTVPLGVALTGRRTIPMVVQSPLIVFRIIHASVALSRTNTTRIFIHGLLGVTNEARTIPTDAVFSAGFKRVIPQQANLAVVLTLQRAVPLRASLQSIKTRRIPMRTLLDGKTKAWIVCKPGTGVKVCARLSIV